MERINVFTLLSRSEKNMGSGMDPKVKALALELVKRAYHEGINVQITSGFRSYAEQNRLYAQGRTAPGSVVTNARGGQSIHNFGLAIDYVIVSEDGSKAIWVVNDKWRRVADIGKSLGFQWGGDWKSFVDPPHLDFQKGYSLASLRAGNRPSIPHVPERSYNGPGDTGAEVKLRQDQLTKAGFQTATDGAYGPGMEKNVRAFQLSKGLQVDGLIGAVTATALETGKTSGVVQATKPTPKPSTPSKPTPKPTAKPSAPSGNSIVDYLNSKGQDSSFAARKRLADQYGIKGYKGTAAQNTELLERLKKGAPKPPPRSTTSGGSIVDYLNRHGRDSSYSARKKLAAQHGIKNYTGTAAQNTQLLDKLQSGSAPKKKINTTSLVDYLNLTGQPSSFSARKRLAEKHGIKNYKGTAAQNTKLLDVLNK